MNGKRYGFPEGNRVGIANAQKMCFCKKPYIKDEA